MAKYDPYHATTVTITQGNASVTYDTEQIHMEHQFGGVHMVADLRNPSVGTKLPTEAFVPNPKKEEQVTNSYHINDDKNAAIGKVKTAVEKLEHALLTRQLVIEKVTLEQDAFVATQVRALDNQLLAAIQEDVLIEELEVSIPAHNGVLAKRVESIFDITGLDKIAELV